jgi:DNA-binding response OmpR family regulator
LTVERILIADADKNTCNTLRNVLVREGFDVMLSHTGSDALEKFYVQKPDAVLTELMLPETDGLQFCREIRKKSEVPIIIISSRSDVFDKVLALEIGADDYIVKPFESREVLARIKAVARRISITKLKPEQSEVRYDKLTVNKERYELKINGISTEIPPKELELLYYLANNPNKVYTRDQLLDEVWGFEYYGDSRTIDVHIKRLRMKLDGISEKWRLRTVWGIGYKFEADAVK